ncbi:hypothetical protein [Mycobacterium sp. 94-17]|uniref:hypothetical protein n=1 Tax=Mycobacterium sp. 94-17 TaxID=2986147 RepID=UPI002D1F14D1|nr:hypothetical protein [Mycobacterium sp. 94-17]MEB4209859.1 hypothetical protein [Mycobacterium sp. 94-17]
MERDMTDPDKDPLSRSQELEDIVDQLEEKVTEESEAEGVPGNRTERDQTVVRGTAQEPPD